MAKIILFSYPSCLSFLFHPSPPSNWSTPHSYFPSMLPLAVMPLAKPLCLWGIPLAGTSSRGTDTDSPREFSRAAAHGNVRLYTAEFANTMNLLFHNVCCCALNPDFHLLYLRGRFWRALLQGKLLQSVSAVVQALQRSPATQAFHYSHHTLLTSQSIFFPSHPCPSLAGTSLGGQEPSVLAAPRSPHSAVVPTGCLYLAACQATGCEQAQLGSSGGSHTWSQH